MSIAQRPQFIYTNRRNKFFPYPTPHSYSPRLERPERLRICAFSFPIPRLRISVSDQPSDILM